MVALLKTKPKMENKRLLINSAFLLFTAFCLITVSCKEDEPYPVFENPTISVVTPENGVEVELEQTLEITLSIKAEAGLTAVYANDQSIQTYGGTEVTDEVIYQLTPTELGGSSIVFKVEDAQGTTSTATFEYVAIEPVVPPFVIFNTFGDLLSTSSVEVESWDQRTEFVFEVTSDLNISQASIQFVASNGDADIVAGPVDGDGNVLQMVPHASAWGSHYVYGMIKLGANIPVEELEQLPQIQFGEADLDNDGKADETSASIASDDYTRVIQLDAYYDDSIVDSVSLATMKQLDPIFGLDLSKGYQITLILAKENPHVTIGSGEIKGMYTAYTAWITEANQWQTLTFKEASNGEARWLNDGDGPNDETSTQPASIDEVNVITIVPAFSQSIYTYDSDKIIRNAIDGDYNHLFFRNLRISNADQ